MLRVTCYEKTSKDKVQTETFAIELSTRKDYDSIASNEGRIYGRTKIIAWAKNKVKIRIKVSWVKSLIAGWSENRI